LAGIDVCLPKIPVLHNCNVQIAPSAEAIKANLVSQLDSPVRWVESVVTMHQQGVDTFIESGPGKVLGGMVKRIIKGVNVACIDKPEAFDALI
jgi:[acyl-carrier-protein] S-malonyltransferase